MGQELCVSVTSWGPMMVSKAAIDVKLQSPVEGQLRMDLLLSLFKLWAEFLIFQL